MASVQFVEGDGDGSRRRSRWPRARSARAAGTSASSVATRIIRTCERCGDALGRHRGRGRVSGRSRDASHRERARGGLCRGGEASQPAQAQRRHLRLLVAFRFVLDIATKAYFNGFSVARWWLIPSWSGESSAWCTTPVPGAWFDESTSPSMMFARLRQRPRCILFTAAARRRAGDGGDRADCGRRLGQRARPLHVNTWSISSTRCLSASLRSTLPTSWARLRVRAVLFAGRS